MGWPGSGLRRHALSIEEQQPLDAALQTDDGRRFRLEDTQGRVVLFLFLDEGDEPVLQQLNQIARAILERGGLVFGVLREAVDGLALIRDEYNLLFTMLSDQQDRLRAALNIRGPGSCAVARSADGRELARWTAPQLGHEDQWLETVRSQPKPIATPIRWRR